MTTVTHVHSINGDEAVVLQFPMGVLKIMSYDEYLEFRINRIEARIRRYSIPGLEGQDYIEHLIAERDQLKAKQYARSLAKRTPRIGGPVYTPQVAPLSVREYAGSIPVLKSGNSIIITGI